MSLTDTASPYLLSHKDNPVQWRTWGPEVLAEAKAKDKPILLSLGYAGCHWCSVMNQESFSDPETAALINDNYIPVLADREERPDLDMLYQGAAGIMSHPGGWPLNMFLTPDGAPYWCAGYLAREERADLPAFRRVLTETAGIWTNQRARAEDTAGKVKAAAEELYNRDTDRHSGKHEPGPGGATHRPALRRLLRRHAGPDEVPQSSAAGSVVARLPAHRHGAVQPAYLHQPWTASCSVAHTTMSAAASSDTAWTNAGSSLPSRRCSMTRR